MALDLAGPIRWRDVREAITRTPQWQADLQLQTIDPIDILTIYEDELRMAEKALNEAKSRATEEKRRSGRKAREAFIVRVKSITYIC